MNITTLEVRGRSYGADLQTESAHSKYVQKPLQALAPLTDQLRSASRLLRLDPQTTTDKRLILEAYTADLALLQTYQVQFESCMQLAIQCSVRLEGINVDTAWKELRAELPAIAKEPLIEFSYIRAAKPIGILLDELQAEVIIGIDRLLLMMSWHLQMIAEAEFFGVIEWSAPDICRYHYFEHDIARKTSTSGQTETHTYDETKEFGQRNQRITRWVESVLRSRISERHVHHVVEAHLYTLSEYQSMVPPNVARFLNRVPTWLRPLLQIVDGTITMEEKVRTRVDENTQTHERMSVSEYSPAVLLGDIALIGWSGVDLRTRGQESYDYQAVAIATHRSSRLRYWIIGIAGALVLASLSALAVVTDSRNTEIQTVRYQNYTVSHSMNVSTSHQYETLQVPENYQWSFGGIHGNTIFFTQLTEEPKTAIDPTLVSATLPWLRPPAVWGSSWSYYGDVDLQQTLGIPATLHVLSANANGLTYTVSYRGVRRDYRRSR